MLKAGLGLEAKFLQNRIGFDIALYNSSTTNQIVSVDIDPIVGASSMNINAGEINNKGIEGFNVRNSLSEQEIFLEH
ncbi:MAG: TonB-dependent receptor [Bacteroidales bacterium]